MEIVAHDAAQRAKRHVELAQLGVRIIADVKTNMPPLGPKIEVERPGEQRAGLIDKGEAVILEDVVNGDGPLMLGLGRAARRTSLVKLDPDEAMGGFHNPAVTDALVIRHASLVRSS